MDDKQANVLFKGATVMVGYPNCEMTPLGQVVEYSTNLESEKESDYVPTKNSFSFSFKMPSLSKWFEERPELKPIKEAQAMLDRLRDYYALWHKYYGMGMRKERRKIERDFNVLAQRFVNHCRLYNITIKAK